MAFSSIGKKGFGDEFNTSPTGQLLPPKPSTKSLVDTILGSTVESTPKPATTPVAAETSLSLNPLTALQNILAGFNTQPAKPAPLANAQKTDITQIPVQPTLTATGLPQISPPGFTDNVGDIRSESRGATKTVQPFSPTPTPVTPTPAPQTNTGLPQIAPPPVMGIAQTPALKAPSPTPSPFALKGVDEQFRQSQLSSPRLVGGSATFNEAAQSKAQADFDAFVKANATTTTATPVKADPFQKAEDRAQTIPVPGPAPEVKVQTPVTTTTKAEPKLSTPVVTPTTTAAPPSQPSTPTPGTPPSTPTRNEVEGRTPSSPGYTPPTPAPIVGAMPTTQLPGTAARPGINRIEYTPPGMDTVQARGALPTAPDLNVGNVGTYLQSQGVGQTNLPTLPQQRAGTFEEYLAKNNLQTLTPQEIADQAKRVREIQTGEALSRVSQERAAAQLRNTLAQQQAGQGKSTALNELDDAYNRKLQQLQALAIGRGLGSAGQLNSNIPLDEPGGFKDALYDFGVARGDIESGIQNRLNQLRLEGQISDDQAAQALINLERQGGLIESQTMSDLQARERAFGEQARQSRFGEFSGIEDINRQRGQDQFANEGVVAQLNEAIRQGRGEEFFRQAGLDQNTRQQGFANEATLAQMLEQQRQADIANNLAKSQQGLAEYQVRSGVENDLTRLQDQLLSGELERALATRSSELEGDPNSLVNQLRAAQAQEAQARAKAALAQAQSGGFTADDAYNITTNIGNQVAAIPALIANKQLTPEAAKALITQARSDYDRIRGDGAFDRTYSGLVGGIEGGATPGAGTPTAVFEAEKSVAQRRVSEIEPALADAERRLQEGTARGLPLDQYPLNAVVAEVQRMSKERDDLKRKYGF